MLVLYISHAVFGGAFPTVYFSFILSCFIACCQLIVAVVDTLCLVRDNSAVHSDGKFWRYQLPAVCSRRRIALLLCTQHRDRHVGLHVLHSVWVHIIVNVLEFLFPTEKYAHRLTCTYTVSQKKQDTKLLAITSLTIIQFSKFFH